MQRAATTSRTLLVLMAFGLLGLSSLSGCTAAQQIRQDMARDWHKTFDGGQAQQSESQAAAKRAAPQSARAKSNTAQSPAPQASTEKAAKNSAVEKWRGKAEGGDPEAEYQLGRLYDKGQDVARDQRMALRWYRSAAEHGHVLAALNAGVLYDKGASGQRDAVAAAFWYRKAAEGGNGRAAYNLAALYEKGDGVPRDSKQALTWYRKAEQAGVAAAGQQVATLSPEISSAETHSVEISAAEPSSDVAGPASSDPAPAESTRQLPSMPRTAKAEPASLPFNTPPAPAPASEDQLRTALAKDYTPGYNEPDDQATGATIRAAAQRGNMQAACNLGMRYVNGRGVPRDWAQAEDWLRRAAQSGFVPAQNNLGMLLASDQNPHANNSEALMWVSKAANAGYGPARAQLGMMYATGRGVPQDKRMADFLLTAAQRDMRTPLGSCAPQSSTG